MHDYFVEEKSQYQRKVASSTDNAFAVVFDVVANIQPFELKHIHFPDNFIHFEILVTFHLNKLVHQIQKKPFVLRAKQLARYDSVQSLSEQKGHSFVLSCSFIEFIEETATVLCSFISVSNKVPNSLLQLLIAIGKRTVNT